MTLIVILAVLVFGIVWIPYELLTDFGYVGAAMGIILSLALIVAAAMVVIVLGAFVSFGGF